MTTQKSLWAYTFIGGGYNQTYATSQSNAIAQAKAEFPSLASQIDEKSFRKIAKKNEDAYYRSTWTD